MSISEVKHGSESYKSQLLNTPQNVENAPISGENDPNYDDLVILKQIVSNNKKKTAYYCSSSLWVDGRQRLHGARLEEQAVAR